MLQSVAECCRVFQSVAECFRVLQNAAECCKVLQSVVVMSDGDSRLLRANLFEILAVVII